MAGHTDSVVDNIFRIADTNRHLKRGTASLAKGYRRQEQKAGRTGGGCVAWDA